ncbi:MAG: globin domain-containing protein [Bacteroidota bacterium]
MTPKQQELVRTSFALALPHQEKFAEHLYQELFRMEPKSIALFRGNMDEQRAKLLRMLRLAVENIGNPEELQPMLYNLGMIHQSFGIEPHHFISFGQALVFGLKNVLNEKFTPEIEDAWKDAYHYFILMMTNFPHASEGNVQLPHN